MVTLPLLPDPLLQAVRAQDGEAKVQALIDATDLTQRVRLLAGCDPAMWLSPWLIVPHRDLVLAVAKRAGLSPGQLLTNALYGCGAGSYVVPRGPGACYVPTTVADFLHELGLVNERSSLGTWWTDRLPLPVAWSSVIVIRDAVAPLGPVGQAPWCAVTDLPDPVDHCPFMTGQPVHPLVGAAWIFNRHHDRAWSLITGLVGATTLGGHAPWRGVLGCGEQEYPLLATRTGVVLPRGWSCAALRLLGVEADDYSLLDIRAIERQLLSGLTREQQPYGEGGTLIIGRDLADWVSAYTVVPAA